MATAWVASKNIKKNGVTDRARTGDIQNHNLGLYQLSYGHRWEKAI